MKICNKCKIEYTEDISFCPKCGKELSIKKESFSCPSCGKELGKEAPEFCPYCGKATNLLLPINNSWVGFSGRIQQRAYLFKAIILLLVPILFCCISFSTPIKSAIMYNLLAFTTSSVTKAEVSSLFIPTLVVLLLFSLIYIILIAGLCIRRLRDLNQTIWLIIAWLAFNLIYSKFFSSYLLLTIINGLINLYLALAKSSFDDNDVVASSGSGWKDTETLKYIYIFVLLLSSVAGWFNTTNNLEANARYFADIQNKRCNLVYAEDICFFKIPINNKNTKVESAIIKKSNYSKGYVNIVTGRTNNGKLFEVGFYGRKDDTNSWDVTNSVFSPIDMGENDVNEWIEQHIAMNKGNKKEKYTVRKCWKTEIFDNLSYAIVLDYDYDDVTLEYYQFNNKGFLYTICIEYEKGADEDYIKSLRDSINTVVWK